jgi:hypothetical protein
LDVGVVVYGIFLQTHSFYRAALEGMQLTEMSMSDQDRALSQSLLQDWEQTQRCSRQLWREYVTHVRRTNRLCRQIQFLDENVSVVMW